MTLTLLFELPEEKYESRCAVHAHDFVTTIYDIDSAVRDFLKHGESHDAEACKNVLEDVRRACAEVQALLEV